MTPLTFFPTPLLRNRGTRDFVTGKRTLRKGRPLRRATHAPLGNSGFYLGCNGGKRQRKNTAKPVIIQYIYIHSHNALYSTQTRSDTRLCLCYVSLRIRRNSRGDDARVVFIALFPLTLGSKHTSPRKNAVSGPPRVPDETSLVSLSLPLPGMRPQLRHRFSGVGAFPCVLFICCGRY